METQKGLTLDKYFKFTAMKTSLRGAIRRIEHRFYENYKIRQYNELKNALVFFKHENNYRAAKQVSEQLEIVANELRIKNGR